jgi:hypothetical protein
MRPDFPFFTSIEQQAATLARDVRLLAQVADSGAALAAKDVSMAGALGSLAMLLEFTRHGTAVDLTRLPVPADTDPLRWLVAFPTYAFWLTADPHRVGDCIETFERHGLVCVELGRIHESPALSVTHGDETELLLDLSTESVTGLWL